jgi:hypothetical protein
MEAAIPIGIVTRNRVVYLDVTLRSLSGTTLSENQPVVIFDDASDQGCALSYLYGDGPVEVPRHWPQRDRGWRTYGLDIVNQQDRTPVGVCGRVLVQRLAHEPLGVVNASCRAIRYLFDLYPTAPGVFLLQDDEVFNADWQQRMLAVVRGVTPGAPLGVLAGCRLNRQLRVQDRQREVLLVTSSVTAQCLYISREGFVASRSWFQANHKRREAFDDSLCKAVRRGGHSVCLINPFVCQHIGMVSLVRPRVGWTSRGGSGRVGLAARPPYVVADVVKNFIACD